MTAAQIAGHDRRRRRALRHCALLSHITGDAEAETYQPMNVNFGLFPPPIPKRRRRAQGGLYRAGQGHVALWLPLAGIGAARRCVSRPLLPLRETLAASTLAYRLPRLFRLGRRVSLAAKPAVAVTICALEAITRRYRPFVEGPEVVAIDIKLAEILDPAAVHRVGREQCDLKISRVAA